MRIVAKASIVVYRDPATNQFFIDPLLPENPLFKLGNFQGAQGVQGVKGDAGADGAAGAQGAQGVQGVQGDAGTNGTNGTNANPAIKLTGATLNAARAGVVLGLAIQSVDSTVPLIGSLVVFKGLLKLQSSSTGTGSMQANIGGLIFTFPNITIAASIQYLHFEVTVHVISSGVGFASVRQSIALNGVAANAVQSNNIAQSGAAVNNTALVQLKTSNITQVTTLFAVCEVL